MKNDECTSYYFKLNNVLTKLSKPTARWMMTFYSHPHLKGKRMYRSRNASTDQYKYTFCDILYDVKYRTECIVLKETPCYVTLAVLHITPGGCGKIALNRFVTPNQPVSE